MAYPFSLKSKSSPNNLGGLAVDANRVALTGAIGSGIQTYDATNGTPVKSPNSAGLAAGLTINIPQDAIQMVCHCTGGAGAQIQVSEDATFASYTRISNGDGPITYDVVRQNKLYFKTDSGSPTLAFHFVLI